ncbi:MAG: DUF2924 domain-containing protein [Acidobacteriota bacterium]|jgi:hypothetical protein
MPMKTDHLPLISELPSLGPQALQDVRRALFGRVHPISSCQHLRRKIAWKLQAAKAGGLPEAVRQLALSIARQTDLRARVSNNVRSRQENAIPPELAATVRVIHPGIDSRLPMPGSLIMKNYRGRHIVVKVLDDGFEYDGRHYTSLSTIANQITGTRWNGFKFFALDKEVRHGR